MIPTTLPPPADSGRSKPAFGLKQRLFCNCEWLARHPRRGLATRRRESEVLLVRTDYGVVPALECHRHLTRPRARSCLTWGSWQLWAACIICAEGPGAWLLYPACSYQLCCCLSCCLVCFCLAFALCYGAGAGNVADREGDRLGYFCNDRWTWSLAATMPCDDNSLQLRSQSSASPAAPGLAPDVPD